MLSFSTIISLFQERGFNTRISHIEYTTNLDIALGVGD